jgi:hypothetical protein
VLLDGLLIPAKLLRNGASIVRESECRSVTYYHVELDAHAVLLAEGLAAESYLDTGNRGMFENADHPLVLHPCFDTDQDKRVAESCAPFAADAERVLPVWQRLADRAAGLGIVLAEMAETTGDPALCVVAGDRVLMPLSHDDGRWIFMLPACPGSVRLVSRSVVLSEQRPWIDEPRRLGVAVERVTLRCGGAVDTIPMDHPLLQDGWWDLERDGERMWRWTCGDATLPLNIGGPAILEVRVSGTLDYPVEDAPAPVAGRFAA